MKPSIIPTVSHLMVRLIVLMNIASLMVELFPTTLPRAVILKWYFASSLALPLYAGLEVWWMTKARSQFKPLVIDALFAFGWFLMWWITVLWALTHPAWL
ncbi:MAG TPA: hypothetical protein VK747_19040 [Blastocatellia bacterium]|nr:hypothetical protein [Blastocatellia bacterium]